MRRYATQLFWRHPVVVPLFAVGVLVIATLAVGQAHGWARWELFSQRMEAASVTVGPASAPRPVASWSFAFGDEAVLLKVPIDETELHAAEGVDTSAMFRAQGSLRSHYIAEVVRFQSRSAFIRALSDELRGVQRERGLDGDEYLELMVRAVQSLRFSTVGNRVRLPVEVVASGFGVCSEKALLLASLMVHEGYETAMWVFDSQNHVAVGVASDGARFPGTGYSFVETTRIAYVGEYDDAYRAAGPVARPPQLVRLGGTRRYGAGHQVEYILGELNAARRRAESLRPYGYLAANAPMRVRSQYVALAGEVREARSLMNYIRGQTDQRGAVFERLVRASAADRGSDSALVVQ